MNRFHSLFSVGLLLVAVSALANPSSASAAERAYRTRSTALLDLETGNFVAAGHGTHLGNYTESGNVSITGDNPFALNVEGWGILVDVHGNELHVTITGEMNFFAGTITGTITFDGAPNGRFVDATGSASLVAQVQEDGTIAVAVVGTIDY